MRYMYGMANLYKVEHDVKLTGFSKWQVWEPMLTVDVDAPAAISKASTHLLTLTSTVGPDGETLNPAVAIASTQLKAVNIASPVDLT